MKISIALLLASAATVAGTAQANTTIVNQLEYVMHDGTEIGAQDIFNNFGILHDPGNSLEVGGILNNYGVIDSLGLINIYPNGKITNHEGGHIIMIDNGMHLKTSSLFENRGRMTVTKSNQELPSSNFIFVMNGTIKNTGSILIDRGPETIPPAGLKSICGSSVGGQIINEGAFEIAKNSRFECPYGELKYIQNSGKTVVDGILKTGWVEFKKGELTGNGTVADVHPWLAEGITLSPGNPLGTLTIVPVSGMDYADCNRCTLNVELGGAAGNDRLVLQGELLLTGSVINVSLRGGFMPKSGDSFEIVNANEILAPAPDLKLPTLNNGLTWTVDYTATAITLRVN